MRLFVEAEIYPGSQLSSPRRDMSIAGPTCSMVFKVRLAILSTAIIPLHATYTIQCPTVERSHTAISCTPFGAKKTLDIESSGAAE